MYMNVIGCLDHETMDRIRVPPSKHTFGGGEERDTGSNASEPAHQKRSCGGSDDTILDTYISLCDRNIDGDGELSEAAIVRANTSLLANSDAAVAPKDFSRERSQPDANFAVPGEFGFESDAEGKIQSTIDTSVSIGTADLDHKPTACPFDGAPCQAIHGRQPSDPFVDFRKQQSIKNDNWQNRNGIQGLDPRIVYMPDVQPVGGNLPSAPSSPNVFSPLPSYANERVERLNHRKAAREDWIHTRVKSISELYRAKVAAERVCHASPTVGNQIALQTAINDLRESVDLDKRQEERRNLFLAEKGMKAIRTGPENLTSDGHAGLRSSRLSSAASGEGALLGGEMAFMERVCAEVVGRDEARIKRV